MSEKNNGMPFVPEEDLDLHENFQPIIAENGLIRPSKPVEVPQNLTVSPDTTFTRMDTVQDLVQIRQAEEQSKAANAAQAPQPTKQQSPANQPEKQSPTEPPTIAKTQTIPSEDFGTITDILAERVTEKTEPAVPATSSPAKAKGKITSDKKEKTVALPEISFAKTIRKNHKSKHERKLAAKAAATIRKFVKKPVTLLPAPGKGSAKVAAKEGAVPQPASSQPVAVKKKHRRWPWVLAVLCFLFLGTVGGVIPVEKIPILRNIAYAMGFSRDDTARMSFLRALLTWTDKTVGRRPSQLAAGEASSSWWARLWGKEPPLGDEDNLDSIYGRAERQTGKTRLININELNAMQLKRGMKVDEVRGSIAPIAGQETELDPNMLKDDNAKVQTEANRKTGDVFFGSDANSVVRNFQDGYDSVSAFQKMNLNISHVEPADDWLQKMAKQMMKADAGLGGVNKLLSGTKVNWGTEIKEVGKEKSHRDLYHAWITSRMAKHTSNAMLKKALADTGFMGAAMPSVTSNVIGYGGLQIDIDALKEDQESWQEYLEFEKQCKEAIEGSSGQIDDAIADFNSIVYAGASELGYPTNCDQALHADSSSFSDKADKIQQVCKNLDEGYKKLADACHMKISATQVVCEDISAGYTGAFDGFKQGCQNLYNAKKIEWENKFKDESGQPQIPEGLTFDNDNNNGWPYWGKTTDVEVDGVQYSNAVGMFSHIRQDGNKFATWIRATCTEDASGNMTCTAENPADIQGVVNTIDDSILKVNGNSI